MKRAFMAASGAPGADNLDEPWASACAAPSESRLVVCRALRGLKPGVLLTALSTPILVLLTAGLVAASGPALPTFTDVTEKAGIRFKHSYGDHHLSNIVEGTGPGGAFFDYNGDGYLDIYLLDGCWLREVNDNLGRDLRGKLANALYRNNGDGTFADVTDEAGVGHQGFGVGASAADYDNDGDVDLYVLNYGPNVFYRNNGDGTFTDVTARSGLGDPRWSLSAPWLDYDNDGDLDVYVANYLEYDAGRFRDFYAAAGYPGPLSYRAQADRLYRNNGDGTFTEVTKEAGLYFPDGRAMSAVATDLNNDGRIDLYVTNDATPNCYYVNMGKGTFEDQTLQWGLAFGEGGQGASSMGPVIGDVDRDGLLDVLIPDMAYGCLLINKGNFFIDVTAPSNLAVICGQYTGWGGGLLDYDNDGYLDVFVATGNPHHEYAEEDVLVRNDHNGKFVDVADQSGPYFREKHVGRGAAFADYDNDGDVDILVMNLNGPAKLLRNDGGNKNNWLTVAPKLAGTKVEAIGARVTVVVGKMQMIHEVAAVAGYLSQSDPRAHFGLGQATKADRVEIRWPDGRTTKLEDVKANRILEVIQDGKVGLQHKVTPLDSEARPTLAGHVSSVQTWRHGSRTTRPTRAGRSVPVRTGWTGCPRVSSAAAGGSAYPCHPAKHVLGRGVVLDAGARPSPTKVGACWTRLLDLLRCRDNRERDGIP